MMLASSNPMPGCIFEYYGHMPESIYTPKSFSSPLEMAVYENNVDDFIQLIHSGHSVSIDLKIGDMTCLEYAAMKGYSDILSGLIKHSVCASVLQEYFSMQDMVDRAFFMSHNKSTFFQQKGLVEANRYVASAFTAIYFNQLICVEVMLEYVKPRDIEFPHTFVIHDYATVNLTATELAHAFGHMECYKIITQWQQDYLNKAANIKSSPVSRDDSKTGSKIFATSSVETLNNRETSSQPRHTSTDGNCTTKVAAAINQQPKSTAMTPTLQLQRLAVNEKTEKNKTDKQHRISELSKMKTELFAALAEMYASDDDELQQHHQSNTTFLKNTDTQCDQHSRCLAAAAADSQSGGPQDQSLPGCASGGVDASQKEKLSSSGIDQTDLSTAVGGVHVRSATRTRHADQSKLGATPSILVDTGRMEKSGFGRAEKEHSIYPFNTTQRGRLMDCVERCVKGAVYNRQQSDTVNSHGAMKPGTSRNRGLHSSHRQTVPTNWNNPVADKAHLASTTDNCDYKHFNQTDSFRQVSSHPQNSGVGKWNIQTPPYIPDQSRTTNRLCSATDRLENKLEQEAERSVSDRHNDRTSLPLLSLSQHRCCNTSQHGSKYLVTSSQPSRKPNFQPVVSSRNKTSVDYNDKDDVDCYWSEEELCSCLCDRCAAAAAAAAADSNHCSSCNLVA